MGVQGGWRGRGSRDDRRQLSSELLPLDGGYAAAPATAGCALNCSGHGSCGNDDLCTCHQDWLSPDTVTATGGRGGGGGDCSAMKCPYEIAWVDTPSSENKAHALAECAGRGLCDRDTGECVCFDGYTGKGCRRTTCPNDCSGHGTCEYISEVSMKKK